MTQEHRAEIMYESKGRMLNGEPFIVIKKARGFYEYAQRGGVDSIAFILYDGAKDKYGLIKESKPPLDELAGTKIKMITAFGGSLDVYGAAHKFICMEEVLEESGYKVPSKNIECIGHTMVSTQMSERCYGYFVDVTGLTPGKTEADEVEKESILYGNEVVWMTHSELFNNNDWKSVWIMCNYENKMIKMGKGHGTAVTFCIKRENSSTGMAVYACSNYHINTDSLNADHDGKLKRISLVFFYPLETVYTNIFVKNDEEIKLAYKEIMKQIVETKSVQIRLDESYYYIFKQDAAAAI